MAKEYIKYIELEVWLQAKQLAVEIYRHTAFLPKEEQFGLISQMRRCTVSIPSNIAEGCGRQHKKESIHFFYIARGSLYELETPIYLCGDLGYLTVAQIDYLLIQLENSRKLLNGFIRYYVGRE